MKKIFFPSNKPGISSLLCAISATSFLLSTSQSFGDTALLGDNLPNDSLNDGDFDHVRASWRQAAQSPYWNARFLPEMGKYKVGIHMGKVFGGGNEAVEFESVNLTESNANYAKPVAGDVLEWEFAGRAEYPCDAKISFSLVFGDRSKTVAEEKKVPGGNVDNAVFTGRYTVTEEDAQQDSIRVRLTLYSSENTHVYVDYADLKVLRTESAGPDSLKAKTVERGIQLSWSDSSENARFNIYRSSSPRKDFKRIAAGVSESSFLDADITNGWTNYYVVTRAGESESSASEVVEARKVDSVPPLAPTDVKAQGEDTVIRLTWKSTDNDIASYDVFRGDEKGENMSRIAHNVKGKFYEDMLPIKGTENTYAIQAIDYSGNVGDFSEKASASVKAVLGASFSDLILPMPIHKELSSDLWGVDDVLPRDPDNGVESPDWTYWGGRVVKDHTDGKYHIINTRWPESARKGHWEWPNSTVAHLVSESPTGPYTVKEDIAYTYKNGLGHNPSVIRLKDGRYMLYTLVNFEPMIFTASSMNGPWKLEGKLSVEADDTNYDKEKDYQYTRNLGFVERPDGSMLVVTKFGAMMVSEAGLLGPYKVLTKTVHHNESIPEEYRKSNYEDPAMWYDGVQYHMLINAFLDYRAIYLRSPDGINWKYDTGLAFTPSVAVYEDGTRNLWDKVERPHVLVDEYGRATHLSLAASDAPKEDDYGSDKHSAKNIILPLVVYKHIEILNSEPIDQSTKRIRLLVRSEDGFDAQKDIDLASLRLGAMEVVNFGEGGKALETTKHKDGLIIEFDGTGNGLTEEDFVCKLIGKSTDGSLLVAYAKLTSK